MTPEIKKRIKNLRNQFDLFYIKVTSDQDLDNITREKLVVQYLLRSGELDIIEKSLIHN